MAMTVLESAEARTQWARLLETIAAGEPMTVMIRYEDYLAVLDELEDARLARRATAVLADLDAGRTDARPWAEIRAEWLAEGVESSVESDD